MDHPNTPTTSELVHALKGMAYTRQYDARMAEVRGYHKGGPTSLYQHCAEYARQTWAQGLTSDAKAILDRLGVPSDPLPVGEEE